MRERRLSWPVRPAASSSCIVVDRRPARVTATTGGTRGSRLAGVRRGLRMGGWIVRPSPSPPPSPQCPSNDGDTVGRVSRRRRRRRRWRRREADDGRRRRSAYGNVYHRSTGVGRTGRPAPVYGDRALVFKFSADGGGGKRFDGRDRRRRRRRRTVSAVYARARYLCCPVLAATTTATVHCGDRIVWRLWAPARGRQRRRRRRRRREGRARKSIRATGARAPHAEPGHPAPVRQMAYRFDRMTSSLSANIEAAPAGTRSLSLP